MSHPLQIAVIGSARPRPGLEEIAQEIGRLIAQAGAVLVNGGGPGVMEAASRGAREAGGDVIGILRTTEEEGEANEYLTHVVATGTGQARNLAVVASGAATIAVGGEWGTLSELAFARRLGRPVVALESWDVSPRDDPEGGLGIVVAESAEQAVQTALRLAEAPEPR